MTYHTRDEWRLPPRGPQHAAPFGSSTPLRIHAHRALRLFVAAGAWGAGLCLIIGLVAMVAKTAGPGRTTHVTAATRRYTLPRGHLATAAPGKKAGAGRVPQLIRTFVGAGDRTTGAFRVAADSRWKLEWSYRCPARAPAGHLIIREGDAGGGGVSVDAAGAAGHGSTWTYSDASAHYLVVITNCDWTVKVTGDQ
jgi:hypothetical protein